MGREKEIITKNTFKGNMCHRCRSTNKYIIMFCRIFFLLAANSIFSEINTYISKQFKIMYMATNNKYVEKKIFQHLVEDTQKN